MEVNYRPRKTKEIKNNGRSADYTTPNFVHNCPMLCAYCYQHRHNESTDLNVATNVEDLLENILAHRQTLGDKKPNQVDSTYWTYDIGCNTDISRVAKYIPWKDIFAFAKEKDLKFTFATKWFNQDFLTFNPDKKVRIRLSLLPEKMIKIMDKGTHSLDMRLSAMEKLYNAGYEVHVNFSPIIVYDGWRDDYRTLFRRVKELGVPDLKAECIFLTHENKKHLYNQVNYPEAEKYLWFPEAQEAKVSQYGGQAIRYHHRLKSVWSSKFRTILQEELPECTIRYLF